MEFRAVFFHFKSGNVICSPYKTGVCLYTVLTLPPPKTLATDTLIYWGKK